MIENVLWGDKRIQWPDKFGKDWNTQSLTDLSICMSSQCVLCMEIYYDAPGMKIIVAVNFYAALTMCPAWV